MLDWPGWLPAVGWHLTKKSDCLPDDRHIAYAADNSLFVTDLTTGQYYRLTDRSSDEGRPVGGIVWSNRGDQLAYNRYTATREGQFAQLFLLSSVVISPWANKPGRYLNHERSKVMR